MFDNFFVFDMSGEIIVSLIVIGLIILFAFVIFFLAKRQDPLKAPKGLLLIAELGVRKADELASSFMNSDKQNFGAYVVSVALYLGLCYFVGMTGLPQPVTSLAIPLTLSLDNKGDHIDTKLIGKKMKTGSVKRLKYFHLLYLAAVK